MATDKDLSHLTCKIQGCQNAKLTVQIAHTSAWRAGKPLKFWGCPVCHASYGLIRESIRIYEEEGLCFAGPEFEEVDWGT